MSEQTLTIKEGKGQAEALIAQAIEKNVSVETMERLLAMRRELKAEWAKEQFDVAMAAFQSECPTIKKTKAVYTRDKTLAYSYAPIESIVEQVKGLLEKHGFSYSMQQNFSEDGKRVKVTCTVKHKDGQAENYDMEVPLGTRTQIMSETQVVAAATTFAKRYVFSNAFGILTGDDDTDAVPVVVFEQHTNESAVVSIVPVSSVISFGKHKGKKWSEVPPEYLQWLSEQDGQHKQTAIDELNRRSDAKMTVDPRKKEIKDICDATNPLLATAEAYKGFVKEKTGLELRVENYDEIIKKLKDEDTTKEMLSAMEKVLDGEVIESSPNHVQSTGAKLMEKAMKKTIEERNNTTV